jgi:DNA-binding SARP family transcriptional activator
LHRLNQLLDKLEPGLSKRLLLVTRQTIQFNQAAVSLDVTEFEAALTAVANHPHRRLYACSSCLARLTQAAELARGELLAGLTLPNAPLFDEWLAVKRERLDYQSGELRRALADLHLQRGDYERAALYAARQIALEARDETAHRQMMLALARQGRRSEALAQYDLCRRLLDEELGLSPDEETAALYEQIAADSLPAILPETGAGRSGAGCCYHFPVYLTPFVGREDECRQIAAELQTPAVRLLTLVAPRGMGKTRLALHAAQQAVHAAEQTLQEQNQLATHFPDGAYFVSMGGRRGAAELAAALGQALELSAPGDVDAYLSDKHILLILDDLAGGEETARFLADLLAAGPGLRLLATAVEPLSIEGERPLPLNGLAYADAATDAAPQSSAAQLFLQTARRARHDFQPDAADWAAIGRICQLTAGSPLALETAAAWLRLLTCPQIAAQLEQGIDWLNLTD